MQDVNNNRNMKCWSSNIMSLLNELGFSYLWNDQALSRSQLNMVIQRIYDHFFQEYYASYDISSKMDVFKTITKHFKLEKYISCIDIEKHRVALSRLRCSAHKLMIEEGRYRGVERNERVCPLCTMNVVEDEYHFLLVCPMYRELRKKYLPSFYCRWPSKNKFIKLLNDNQVSVLKKLAKFVYIANEKRLSLLNDLNV